MKTKLFFPALCALLLCFVACDKKNEPNEPIAGVFSVSPTKQVTFAPGNLQYQASTNTWRFAQHQYDIIGKNNKNISSSYSGWIDLFGWGTGSNPTNISTSSSEYIWFVDWGTNQIGSYPANTWRTLSSEEWYYIFCERPNASKLYGYATVNGQAGVIVLPDNTTLSLPFSAGMNDDSQNTYSATEWESFEKVGALFLPASGDRYGTNVDYVGNIGYYWSSTPYYEGDVYYVYFYDIYLHPQNLDSRYYGYSVRLVKDVK